MALADPGAQTKEQLLQLANQQDNCSCADCGEPKPQWASASIGVFICIGCAGIHRNLGVHVSRVKSLMLDLWRLEEFEMMKTTGNLKSNLIYEGGLNASGHAHPSATDSTAFKEQWIRAKYIRKLYQKKPEERGQSMLNGQLAVLPSYEGWMTKKGDLVKNWKRRYFKLHGSMLFYFKKKEQQDIPAGLVCIADTVKPPDCLDPLPDHPFTFVIPTRLRDYLICTDNAEDMYEWVQQLRASRKRLCDPAGIGLKATQIAPDQLRSVMSELGRYCIVKRQWKGKWISNCTYGASVVDVMMALLALPNREEAVQLAQRLMIEGNIRSVTGEPFQDGASLYQIFFLSS